MCVWQGLCLHHRRIQRHQQQRHPMVCSNQACSVPPIIIPAGPYTKQDHPPQAAEETSEENPLVLNEVGVPAMQNMKDDDFSCHDKVITSCECYPILTLFLS